METFLFRGTDVLQDIARDPEQTKQPRWLIFTPQVRVANHYAEFELTSDDM